jgi:hypothetical protein
LASITRAAEIATGVARQTPLQNYALWGYKTSHCNENEQHLELAMLEFKQIEEFKQMREAIDSLIDEAKLWIQKKSNTESMERIESASELLQKLKQMATNEQLWSVARRESTLKALTDYIIDLKSIGQATIKQDGGKKNSGNKCCIYAIKKKKDLDEAYKNGKMGTFIEDKTWRAGFELFEDAVHENTYLPIVFANAESIWELLYWAKLTKVKILPNTHKQSKSNLMTQYSFKDMQRYPKKYPPYNITDLTLDSTGEPIKEGFIKSYAICRKPKCLK